MPSLSTPAISSLMAENTGEVWLPLLTFTHPDLTAGPIRIVANNEPITSNGHDFIALPFDLILPNEDADNLGECQVSIMNVDSSIVALLRGLTTPPSAMLQVVLASSPNSVEIELDGLVLRDVQYDADTIRGSLRFFDMLSEPIAVLVTPDRFPALF